MGLHVTSFLDILFDLWTQNVHNSHLILIEWLLMRHLVTLFSNLINSCTSPLTDQIPDLLSIIHNFRRRLYFRIRMCNVLHITAKPTWAYRVCINRFLAEQLNNRWRTKAAAFRTRSGSVDSASYIGTIIIFVVFLIINICIFLAGGDFNAEEWHSWIIFTVRRANAVARLVWVESLQGTAEGMQGAAQKEGSVKEHKSIYLRLRRVQLTLLSAARLSEGKSLVTKTGVPVIQNRLRRGRLGKVKQKWAISGLYKFEKRNAIKIPFFFTEMGLRTEAKNYISAQTRT